MKRSKHFYSLAIAILFLVVAIASTANKKSMTVEHKQVAPDFPGYKGVLLIREGRKNWTKYAKRYFTEEYKGQVEVVAERDMNSGKYVDKAMYRFAILQNISFHDINGHLSSSESVTMYDRQTEKYYSTQSGSNFGDLLKTYAQVLEELRGK
jgi:hypothetical protein